MGPTSKRIVAYAANGGDIPSGRVYKDIRFEESSSEYRVVMSESGTYAFPVANLGYSKQSPKAVTISNEGNNPTGVLTLSLSGENPNAFVLATNTVSSIAARNSDIFTIAPVERLPLGTYSAVVTMGGANGIFGSFTVKFSVAFLYPMVSVGNPQYTPVTSNSSLILNFNTRLTAVPGVTIQIIAVEKRYEYLGTTAIPVSFNYLGYGFIYNIPPEGLDIIQTGNGYSTSIPLNSFSYLSTFMTYSSNDPYRSYEIFVPEGAFIDCDGVSNRSMFIESAFFSKNIGIPTATSITPANGATDAEQSGEIVIEFSRQMDKATPGTVSLSSSVSALAHGTWSANGRTYTVE
jgi:hypothetical protein